MKKSYDKLNLYCQKNNIDYLKIKNRIKYMNKTAKYKELSFEQKLNIAKEKYNKKQYLQMVKFNLNQLKLATTNKQFKCICEDLKISWQCVQRLFYKNISKKEAINYIWFFNDYEKNGYKYIKFNTILNLNKQLFDNNIYYKIVFYYNGYSKFLPEIISYEEKYLKTILFKVSRNFNLKLKKDIREDLMAELNLILIKTLNNIILNNINQIGMYISTILYWRLWDYVNINYRQNLLFDENYQLKKEYENNNF